MGMFMIEYTACERQALMLYGVFSFFLSFSLAFFYRVLSLFVLFLCLLLFRFA